MICLGGQPLLKIILAHGKADMFGEASENTIWHTSFIDL